MSNSNSDKKIKTKDATSAEILKSARLSKEVPFAVWRIFGTDNKAVSFSGDNAALSNGGDYADLKEIRQAIEWYVSEFDGVVSWKKE